MEAESVAYPGVPAAGLASDDYSLPYVARWSEGDPAQVRLTADRMITTGQRILQAAGLVPHADKLQPQTFRQYDCVSSAGPGPRP